MTKRFISMLLVLVMLAAMFVVPVSAQTEAVQPETVADLSGTCPCGCGENLTDVQWTRWDPNAGGTPSAGHYYLDGDYVQKDQQEIISGNKIVLDLRGHALTTDDHHRLFLLHGYIAVIDSVGSGRFSAKTTGAGFGGIVMISNNETNDATFELYGGTMMPDDSNKGSRRGGLVHLGENTTFRMYGGRLMNGTTVNGSYKESGGAIAGNSATSLIEILGGEIIGCESSSSGGSIYSKGTTILKNCRIIGGVAATGGGNIHQAGGTLTIENCEISSGIANTTSSGGGNIAVTDGAVVDIKDSTICNGYAVNHGGNIYIGKAEASVENTEVYSGVAGVRGGNIYGSTSTIKMVIKDCEFPGDIGYAGSGLELQGKVKIGLLNTGIRLVYGSDKATVDASALAEGSEIYVAANHTFADTTANIAYFKGANRTVLSESAEGLVGTYAASGELGGYCPHCNERVVWNLFSTTDSVVQNCLQDSATDTDTACTGKHIETGHYYLGESLTGFSQHYIGVYLSDSGTLAVKDVVLDLAGYSITGAARSFYLRPKDENGNMNQLTLLDSYGGGKSTGSGANNQGGGVIYNEGGILNIYGGKYIYKYSSTRNVAGGGVIYGGNTMNMYGGILDGSAYVYTDASTSSKTYTYNGGTLHFGNGVKYFTMTAGVMLGGHAQEGGAVFFGYNNKINITGGQFIGGQADGNGGVIRLYSAKVNGSYPVNGVLNMSGAAVRDGKAATAGGNVYAHYYTVNLNNCYIDGGSTDDFGGNINNGTSATVTYTDCFLINGSAKRGGNFYAGATSSRARIISTTLISGNASTYAGNLNAGNGCIDVEGCEILYGTAGTYAGNVSATAGNYSATSDNYTRIGANENGKATLIAGGVATTTGGNIHLGGVLYLDAAKVISGTAGTTGNDIHMNKLSKQSLLEIGSGVVGEMSAYIHNSYFSGDGFGSTINNTACNVLNAKITLEGDYDGAILCSANGKLCLGAIAVVDKDGVHTWFVDAAEAMDACPKDGYIRLFSAQDLVMTKDCAVDICGNTVNVSGAYTLYGMDSSGDEFAIPSGKVIAADETTVASNADVCGKQYIAVSETDGMSFHRIQAQITEVALRPSADGLYYTGSFGCDATVGTNIASYGIAVSTVNMPGEDFMTDGDTLYTEFEGSTMENGAKKTGVLVSGILKDTREATLNSAYGQMPVFATAYLKLNDGSIVLSDTESHNDDIAYSLYDLLATLDSLIMEDPINYRILTNPLRNFHSKWKDNGMGDWDLNKIPDPGDNGVIDVLMIGGSFNYYYVEELYGMAEAAGIPMRVCNLYYSGAGPKQHWTWWKNQESPCQFFNTDGNGRVKTEGVSLEWALAQGEWDVLSLQYPSGTVKTSTAKQGFDELDQYARELSDYLHEQFPDAMQCWGQVWGYQVGYDRDGYTVPDRETQVGLYQRHKELAYMAADAYDRVVIPCGEAWEFVRQGGYDSLCARLGKGTNHEGDYYHEGDIGGGQYLNACVWFEMITGESCVGNTYVPSYVYNSKTYYVSDDISLETLQAAAHRAVEEYKEIQ